MYGTNLYSNFSYGSIFDNASNALTNILRKSVVEPVFLCEMTVGQSLNIWNLVSGDTYQCQLTEQFVESVLINGEPLLADPTLNSDYRYYFNTSTKVLQIRTPVNPNLVSEYVQVIYNFYIADRGIIKNGIYYDSLISALPALTLRNDVTFGSVVQLGGGALELMNETAIWDSRSEYEWQAGSVNLFMGTVDLPYEEFVQIGCWSCDYFQRTTEKFTVNLISKKTNIDVQIPFNIYTQAQYPNLKIDQVGLPIPWAYGTVYGAPAVCIDTISGVFSLAGHPITAINQVRVSDDSQNFNVVFPISTDLDNATFVLASGDWSLSKNQTVSVDLLGKPGPNGFMMNNGADIVTDIFTNLGLDNLDYNSFNNSRNYLDLGYYNFNILDRACQRVPSVYLSASGSATDILQTINGVTNAYLFMDGKGNFNYKVFTPVQEFQLVEIHDEDILTFQVASDAGLKTSEVIVNYSYRSTDDYEENLVVVNSGNQWLRNQQSPVIDTRDQTPLSNITDAIYYGQQILLENQYPLVEYIVDVKWKPWLLTAGDFVHLVYEKHNVDLVLEIAEINYDLTNRKCNLTLTTAHGLSGRQGFWVEDNTKYDWDNSSSPLSQTEKQQNSGHWHNDFYIATSGTATAQDYNISVWC